MATSNDARGGLEPWWTAMEAGRRWLEELGAQVQANADGSVRASDLGPVLDAVELLERRVHGLDGRLDALHGKVDGLTAALGDLTAVIEALADRVSGS